MKNLITGGTGFLATALIPRLEGDIRILARNEGKIAELKQKFPHVEVMIGDVEDPWIVKKAMQGVTNVWHLAATKSVDLAEKNVLSTIKTNVIGTLNLLEESFATKPKTFLFVSTDKAAQVSGVYGSTKLLGERLVNEAQEINPDTKYRTVRYGNIFASTASFITKWVPSIEQGNGIKITDPDMTRFFWTADEAVSLIFDCVDNAPDSKPWIPEIKAMRMGDIVVALKEIYGEFPVEVIGNRGGENAHETMGNKDSNGNIVFSNQVDKYSVSEIKELFLIPYIKKVSNEKANR